MRTPPPAFPVSLMLELLAGADFCGRVVTVPFRRVRRVPYLARHGERRNILRPDSIWVPNLIGIGFEARSCMAVKAAHYKHYN